MCLRNFVLTPVTKLITYGNIGADRVGAGGVRMKPTVDLVTVVESICMNQNETVSVVHFLGPDGLSLQFLCKAWNEMQVTKDICKSSFCQL